MSFREALPLSSLAISVLVRGEVVDERLEVDVAALRECQRPARRLRLHPLYLRTCTRAQAGGVGKRGLGRAGGLGAGGVAAHAIANVLLFERERPARLLRRHELLV